MTADRFAPLVRTAAAELRESGIATLAELTALDAPTGDPALLGRVASILEDRLRALGAEIERIPAPAGDHLVGRLGAAGDPAVLILTHYDTVWPAGTVADRPLRIEAGVAHGPGVFDMRGGIVAALTALAIVRDLKVLDRPVAILLTADEEGGSRSSQDLIQELGRTAGTVLIPEPPLPGGGLKTVRKGLVDYEVHVTGLAAHAGLDPDRGVSAISELVALLARLETEARPEAGTTVNAGVIHGGTRPNVVAAEATAELDLRVSTMREFDRITAVFESLTPRDPRASVRVERVHGRAPMERTPAIAGAFGRARELARLLDIDLSEGSAGGGSDGNFLASEGVAVLDGLGPDGGGAHAVDEHVLLDSLEERAALLAMLIAHI